MKKNTRSIPSKRPFSKLVPILLIIVVAIILLILNKPGLDKQKRPEETQPKTPTAVNAPLPPSPQAPPSDLSKNQPPPPEAAPQPAYTEAPPESSPCQQAAEELNSLFSRLDQQEYVKAYTQNTPIQTVLGQIFTKLLNNPPVITNETSDLLSVIRNSSHLYRVLGRKDLSLLKEIITYEHSSLEKDIALLYRWSTMGQSCQESSGIKIDLPLSRTYQYAAFFLNTLGGQSYLARRDPALRTLAKFYCVLTLDRAADASLDMHTIDLAYQIDSTLADLAGNDILENQESYIQTLTSLQAKRRNKR